MRVNVFLICLKGLIKLFDFSRGYFNLFFILLLMLLFKKLWCGDLNYKFIIRNNKFSK